MTPPPSDPERSRTLNRQADVLRAEGRWQDALALSFEAFRADRTNAAAAHNVGALLGMMGRLHEAETAIRHALTLAPGVPMITHALAHVLLAQGRYKEGWVLNEARTSIPELRGGFPRDFPFPRWRGEPLAGKTLVVFPEQGLGDQIQFCRFLPRVIEQAGRVILLAPQPLERLFHDNFPTAEIVLAAGAVEFPDPDYWITLQDLPGLLGIEVANIPAEPYLGSTAVWPDLGGGFKIGLKTKGSARHVGDGRRSLPEEFAAQLRTRLPGRVISLEPEESGAADLADTAAIIDQLDLVVSVDTSVAHLAGALGKPCLLLIPGFGPDWRWMFGREDSPWYPQHRLFRSDIGGDWQGAIDRLVAEAQTRAALPSIPAAMKGDAALAALMQRAVELRNRASFSQALDTMRQAVRKAPQNPAALDILGTMLADVGRFAEAEKFQRRALAIKPDYPAFQYDLANTLLAQGRYAEAWPLYEARSAVPSLNIAFPKGIEAPRWRGEDLAGKRIAVMPEQGQGDAIQFARFLPWLRERGAQVRLYANASLVDLFATSFPDIEVLAADGEVRLGAPDYWTTLVDMAGPLGISPEGLPQPPYLRTGRTWTSRDAGFTIGIQTKGNPQHANDAWRSLSAADAESLRSRLPGNVVDLDPRISGVSDFADTAALIGQVDLVVSVDTSVGHLAGALGKPCLLLVPSLATDWRWTRGRDDSPWYPSHHLFWGAMDGGWNEAITAVVAEAERMQSTAR